MKKQILTLSFALCAAFGYSQSNIFPSSGNAAIGNTSPTYKFEITRGLNIASQNIVYTNYAFFGYRASFAPSAKSGLLIQELNYPSPISASGTRLQMISADNPTSSYLEFNAPITSNTTRSAVSIGYNNVEFFRVNQDGKVRIGSNNRATPDGYRLFVEQGILTEKVKVAVSTLGDWSDYVFAPDYKLMPLEEVEQFTKENKHLPNVPSASDMVSNGLDVAQMDAKLLEKIEELTLYAVQQNNETKQLRAELQAQKTETKELNEKQAKEIEELKNMVKVLLEKK